MIDPRRGLPSVSALLELEGVQRLEAAGAARPLVVDAVRRGIAAVRAGAATAPESPGAWVALVERMHADGDQPVLTRVLNATGVVLHTNLGRAPLAAAARRALQQVADDYCDLEYDIPSGSRGSRHHHCVALLRELTGAEDALVVNNCAAAVTLALRALAAGRPVAISRGELVEIGGSFRVPEVMQVAGVELVEIGTTNRTHESDYVRALDAGVAAVVKVHHSNFRIEGFTADVSVRELARICADRSVPLIHDFGSGLMLSLDRFGLTGEQTARDAVHSGATIVAMSGDKLLGGPQAGILLGTRHALEHLRRDPLARAVRIDKLGIAALAATLQLYRNPDVALRTIPTLAMLTAPADQLHERAVAVADRLRHAGMAPVVVESDGAVGAGAFPTTDIPSWGVALPGDAQQNAARLRSAATPVIGRIQKERLVLNLRSVPERHDDLLGDSTAAALG